MGSSSRKSQPDPIPLPIPFSLSPTASHTPLPPTQLRPLHPRNRLHHLLRDPDLIQRLERMGRQESRAVRRPWRVHPGLLRQAFTGVY
jgi:hypothetical protein